MSSKDVAEMFGFIFAGVLLLTILLGIWEGMDGMLLGICVLACGGLLLSFTPLIIERLKGILKKGGNRGNIT